MTIAVPAGAPFASTWTVSPAAAPESETRTSGVASLVLAPGARSPVRGAWSSATERMEGALGAAVSMRSVPAGLETEVSETTTALPAVSRMAAPLGRFTARMARSSALSPSATV